jgi:HK97 family phage major capsid protein
LSKSATTGAYYAAGILSEDGRQLWGLDVIVSPMISQGTALVGDFTNGAKLHLRDDVRMTFAESGLSDDNESDMFRKNQIRIRAEERLGFELTRPDAFTVITNVSSNIALAGGDVVVGPTGPSGSTGATGATGGTGPTGP